MLTYRVLSALISYPDPDLRGAVREGVRILCDDRLLSGQHIAAVCSFADWLLDTPQLEAESAYIEAFDRGRSTSLYMFEHIHGESRARGEAMHKLLLRYRAHGLELEAGELPDFLPLFLEFLSTRPANEAAKHLAEVSDIVALIGRRLRARRSARPASRSSCIAGCGHSRPPSRWSRNRGSIPRRYAGGPGCRLGGSSRHLQRCGAARRAAHDSNKDLARDRCNHGELHQ
jgi:nitrate reductase molybdenum cofactor assembly chaperone NarJ/NarW